MFGGFFFIQAPRTQHKKEHGAAGAHSAQRKHKAWRCFLFFIIIRDRILDGSRCLKKNSCQTRKRGHYCTLLCDIPLPAPVYCLQYCAIYFPG